MVRLPCVNHVPEHLSTMSPVCTLGRGGGQGEGRSARTAHPEALTWGARGYLWEHIAMHGEGAARRVSAEWGEAKAPRTAR